MDYIKSFKADNEALFGSWHPENWDQVTLEWLKRPEGRKMLSALQSLPDLVATLEFTHEWLSSFSMPPTSAIAEKQLAMRLIGDAIKKAKP